MSSGRMSAPVSVLTNNTFVLNIKKHPVEEAWTQANVMWQCRDSLVSL